MPKSLKKGLKSLVNLGCDSTPQLELFGLAVSYLEGDEALSSQDKKLSEIQLWSGVTVFKEKDAAALL